MREKEVRIFNENKLREELKRIIKEILKKDFKIETVFSNMDKLRERILVLEEEVSRLTG